MLQKVTFSYCEGYYAPIPEDHIFPMRKFEGLAAWMQEKHADRVDILAPTLAPEELLLNVHTPEYVYKILHGTQTRKEERRMGLPWSPGLALRSRYAVQGTLNAARNALKDGVSGNLAGGTHHAMPDHGEGFCVFNDVAIAIRALLESGEINSAWVIDLDVHQGNGTAAIFADEPQVTTISMHGHRNYPFHKPKSDIDIGLPDNCDNTTYLWLLNDLLTYLNSLQQPDILFYLGGIDVLETDHFGRIALSLQGLQDRDLMVVRYAKERQIPLCALLSGGYAPTIEQTVQAHASMFEAVFSQFLT